ncbi:hypothetical protein DL96DRAFT_1591652 [Flagelloscypha sp. PMI_526]|nr:hypothetical protein DL96DRAFT_1591652 [Flagelloscypha sp. PMI_526]
MQLHSSTFSLLASALETNVTVDDGDTAAIQYSTDTGTWAKAIDDAGKSYHTTSDSRATAVFTFNGTAIYLLTPTLSNTSGFFVSLDDTAPIVVKSPSGSRSPSATLPSVSWSQTGLVDRTHTVVVSKRTDDGRPLAVGGFIYTQVTSDANVVGETLTGQQPQYGPPPPPKKKGISLFGGSLPKTIAFIVGLLVGIILLGAVLVWWLFFARKHDVRRAGPVAFSHWAISFSKPMPSTNATTTTDIESGVAHTAVPPPAAAAARDPETSSRSEGYRVVNSTGPVFVLEGRRHSESPGYGSRPSLERDPTLPRRSLQQQRRRSSGTPVMDSQASEARRSQPAFLESQVEKAQLLRHLSTRTELSPPAVLETQTGITPPPAYTCPCKK